MGRFLEWAEVLLTWFRILLYLGFIFYCSSNPPGISHTLLCWRVMKHFLFWGFFFVFFFAPHTETHFQAIWPLLTVWETKSMSHFHCALPLCDAMSLSQLVTWYPHNHNIQADIDGGFRGIWGSYAHVQLYEEVPLWGPSELRKWSRCKASGSRNPVGHLPCCSCTAPCQIHRHRLPSPCKEELCNVLLHSDFLCSLYNICVSVFTLSLGFCFMLQWSAIIFPQMVSWLSCS